MSKITAIWTSITSPHPKITDIQQRIQSRLLAFMLAIIIPLGFSSVALQAAFVTGTDTTFKIVSTGILLFLLAFILNKNGWVKPAIYATVAMPIITCFSLFYLNPQEIFAYAFIIIGILFSGIFLSVRETALLALLVLLLEITLLTARPEVAPLGDYVMPPMFVLIVSALILLAIKHREIHEAIRSRALVNKERNLVRAQELAETGSWEWNLETNTTQWSDQLYNIFGISPQECINDSWQVIEKYTHPDDLELVKRKINAAIDSCEQAEFEFRIVKPDGEQRVLWVEVDVASDKNGQAVQLYGIAQDITERALAQQAIRQSQEELSAILESMQDTYYRTDIEGRIIKLSPAVEQLLGYKIDELLGTKMADLYVDEQGREQFLIKLHESKGRVNGYEAPLKHKNNSHVWVSTNAQYYFDKEGKPAGVEGTTRDITSKKATELEMSKLSSALQQTADSVVIMDTAGRIEFANAAFESISGLKKEAILGQHFSVFKTLLKEDKSYDELWNAALEGRVLTETFVNRCNSRQTIYEQKTITPIRNAEQNVTHFVITGKNITDYVRSQEKLQYLAQHDVLTELPNRVLMIDRLKHAIARTLWHKRNVAVLFLDLDRFKAINDSLGHETGDVLLKELADRLHSVVRDGDTIGRLGGDEFAIILDDVASESDISQIAQKILDSVAPPFEIAGRSLHVTASIGISISPGDSESPELLLRYADIAMYRAKDLGKNNYQFYSKELSAKAFERLNLENNLRNAIKNSEFLLYFQPQFDLKTSKIIGVESLIRWQHPEIGMIMPADFIYVLEETGLIDAVGEWVIRTACVQMAKWRKMGFDDLRLGVNVSSRQCNNADFASSIEAVLRETGLAPEKLELEITESLLMKNVRSVDETLNKISKMGIRLAIDDFGTGYSSLSYLKLFPIDTLKIDRSFVRDIEVDKDDLEIVKAIIAMGKTLGMEVIAEGVEKAGQKEILLEQECLIAQGFMLSKPVPADAITELLMKTTEQQITYA